MTSSGVSHGATLSRQRIASPRALLAATCGLQLGLWTLVPAIVHQAPPLDVVEAYAFGPEWLISTYKHPAAPSWLLETSRLVTHTIGWPAYLISQICIVLTFLFTFLLGRELMDESRAAAGAMLLTGLIYTSWRAPEFNHNILQMPLWTASAWALWRAVDRSTSASWAVAGLLSAAMLYAKLSSVAFLAAAAVWLMSDAKARRTLATPAPWLGGAVFLISVSPLAWSIYADGFKPLAYASARSHSGGIALLFAPKLVGSMAGAIAVAAYAGLMPSRLSPKSKLEPAPVGARAWRFLLFLGLGPVILVTTIFELAGMGLRSSWGAPMTVLVGLIVVAADPRFTSFKLTRVARGAASLLIAVPMGYAGVTVLSARMAGHVQRVSWPQAEMAARFRALWQRALGGPLGIVAGPDWIAGLVALDGVRPASVLFNSRLDENRRLSSETLRREGFLIVWDADDPLRAIYQMRNWTAGRREGVETFHWPFANAGELRIGYALIPPAGDRGSRQ